MKCEKCGAELREGIRFCEECGAPVSGAESPAVKPGKAGAAEEKKPGKAENAVKPAPAPAPATGRKVSENVYLCPDGVYRWTYEFPMLKNPVILFTVYKVLLLSLGIVWAAALLISLFQGTLKTWLELWELTRIFLLIGAGALVLGLIAYLIVAGRYGWKYVVLFEMDDRQLKHIQMKKQFEAAKAAGWLTAAAGLATGSAAAAGAGILSSVRDTSTTTWKRVRSVRVKRRLHLIRLNQLLARNQVYASPEDFDFVLKFIREHTDGGAK